MGNYEIEFEKLLEENKSKSLFSGRKNGEKAFLYFKLDKANSEDSVVLNVPSNIVVSSSYFLGLLENLMRKFDDIKEYKKHIDDSNLSAQNLREYERAVKRGFHKNTGFF